MKNPKFHFFLNSAKQIVPCESAAEEVSFEWSHHRILSTDSKVRTTINVSITDSGSERVKTDTSAMFNHVLLTNTSHDIKLTLSVSRHFLIMCTSSEQIFPVLHAIFIHFLLTDTSHGNSHLIWIPAMVSLPVHRLFI